MRCTGLDICTIRKRNNSSRATLPVILQSRLSRRSTRWRRLNSKCCESNTWRRTHSSAARSEATSPRTNASGATKADGTSVPHESEPGALRLLRVRKFLDDCVLLQEKKEVFGFTH